MGNVQIQTLKGFRDFLPEQAKKRRWLIDSIRRVFERFGYEPLETPALEYEALLTGKYGDEADKLIYGFEDRGGRRVALRYDQTVPTARIISQYRNELVFPFKRYQIQPVWRADKPQKGRYREFLQCDADIIGSKSESADADILAVYAAIYLEIGISSIKIKLNDRQQLIETIKTAGIAEDQIFTVIQTIDKLDKKTEAEVIQELVQKGLEVSSASSLISSLKKGEPSARLNTIINQAIKLGVPATVFSFEPTLARGLDYYTGLIFEGTIPEYTVGSVGGGGRYDNLIKDLIGMDTPAVGFGLGFDRTLEAAEALGKIPTIESSTKILVSVFSPELQNKSLELTRELRENGISAECYMENRKIDAQLKYADKKNIPFFIICGPEESVKNTVKIKNMKTGEQVEVANTDITNYLKTR